MNKRIGKRRRGVQNQKPNPTQNADNKSSEKDSGTADPIVQSSASGSPVHQPKPSAEGGKPADENKHWLDYATGIFAFIAAIAATAAAIFSGWQAWIASDNEIRQLRAYAHITGGKITVTGDPAGPLDVSLQPGVKVFGQTPAGQVVVPWALIVDRWPMTEQFQFNYLPTQMQSTSSQAPGEERPIDAKTRTITKEETAAIRAGTQRLYAYGTILYRDVFNVSRYTNFCWSFDAQGITNRAGSDCPIHNGADWVEEKPSAVKVPMK